MESPYTGSDMIHKTDWISHNINKLLHDTVNVIVTNMSTGTLDDFKKVFENDFWIDQSDEDEGIGSDDSMENNNNNVNDEQKYFELKPTEDVIYQQAEKPIRKTPKSLIKRSKSLLVINHFGSRIIQQIRR